MTLLSAIFVTAPTAAWSTTAEVLLLLIYFLLDDPLPLAELFYYLLLGVIDKLEPPTEVVGFVLDFCYYCYWGWGFCYIDC